MYLDYGINQEYVFLGLSNPENVLNPVEIDVYNYSNQSIKTVVPQINLLINEMVYEFTLEITNISTNEDLPNGIIYLADPGQYKFIFKSFRSISSTYELDFVELITLRQPTIPYQFWQ